jgi:molybdopterin synthase catalytic subunit
MTETLLQEIVDQANRRWNLIGSSVIHRVGELLPTDQIVFVGVASQHRADAFEAAQFLMDYLKTKATFWKQISQDGKQHWVESKESDTDAAARWGSIDD